jgi:hypothetical protein
VRFPTLDEVIACNEAAREPNETSPSADDDALDLVERALERARNVTDPIDAAATLAFEITRAQGFYEGNKRTAVLITRWFVSVNTSIDPDRLIPPHDRGLADLLIRAARQDRVGDEILALLRSRVRIGDAGS